MESAAACPCRKCKLWIKCRIMSWFEIRLFSNAFGGREAHSHSYWHSLRDPVRLLGRKYRS